MKKYQLLYDRIRRDISEGLYSAGERLMSIREQSGSSGYSVNTVLRAYELLVDEGLIKTTERGGYYLRSGITDISTHGFGKPLPLPNQFVSEAEEAGEKLDRLYTRLLHIDASFASAAPGEDLLPTEQLIHLASRLNNSWINYGYIEGESGLRQRIALVNKELNPFISPEDIIVTNGATEAMTIVLHTLLKVGDTVAVESPTYHNFFRQLAASGLRIIEIPVGPDGMDLDKLEGAFKKDKISMVIVQPNIQNPTGVTMNDYSRIRLVELAKKHRATILQDDVYGDLYFGANRPGLLSGVSDYSGIITISSFSKSIAPGLRIGWIESGTYKDRFQETKLQISMESNIMAQKILKNYIGTKAHRRHLKNIRINLESRVSDYINFLSDILPEGSHVRRPSGGCLLWIGLTPDVDSAEVFKRSASRGIIAAPGALFTASNHFDSYIRLNVGFKLSETRRRALRVFAESVRNSKGSLL